MKTLTKRNLEEPILPVDFPAPRPVSTFEIIQNRDGDSCRLCNAAIDRGAVEEDQRYTLLALPVGGGERPELTLVTSCRTCCNEVTRVRCLAPQDECSCHKEERGRLRRLLKLLYLENCTMAEVAPLQEVAR